MTFSSDPAQPGSVTIQDNGIGIDSKNKERVFELFQTGDNQSSGIGLATVKKIMEMQKVRFI
ncbi:ATP-binding protein [Alkalibacterium kapii]|uniref:ATP-binding protein n=1 Tax=Alkalibacterium kapii TaxID=426704 RepID=UPI0011BFA23A|nr:ATP-binding protein [Alkalibacterium kapii]